VYVCVCVVDGEIQLNYDINHHHLRCAIWK
jgi:hypothetical protein